MRTLHRRDVKGYITFNTLVFEHELAAAARTLAGIAEAGADAIIVQDLGVLRLARQIAPDLAIHASTQMSVTSADGARLAQSLGASRVTLARELSLGEVRAIREATDCELEIFVHGRVVCGLFRAMFFVGSLGRAQRQPAGSARRRAVCRMRWWWTARRRRWAMRDTCSRRAICSHCGRFRKSSGWAFGAEDRRPIQGCRVRGAHYARVPAGGG